MKKIQWKFNFQLLILAACRMQFLFPFFSGSVFRCSENLQKMRAGVQSFNNVHRSEDVWFGQWVFGQWWFSWSSTFNQEKSRLGSQNQRAQGCSRNVSICWWESKFHIRQCFALPQFCFGELRWVWWGRFLGSFEVLLTRSIWQIQLWCPRPKWNMSERSIFQTFWKIHSCTKFLSFELETSNFGSSYVFSSPLKWRGPFLPNLTFWTQKWHISGKMQVPLC